MYSLTLSKATVAYLYTSSGALIVYNKWLWVEFGFKWPVLTTCVHLLASGVFGILGQVPRHLESARGGASRSVQGCVLAEMTLSIKLHRDVPSSARPRAESQSPGYRRA